LLSQESTVVLMKYHRNKYLNTPAHSLSEHPKFGNIPVFSYGQKTTRRDASQREG